MKKILLALILLAAMSPVGAAEKPKYVSDTETRISAKVKKSFFKKSLSVEFSPEVRFNKPMDYDKTLLQLSVEYDVMKWFEVGVGYRAVFNETKKRGTEITGGFNATISKSIKVGSFRIKPRIRFTDYQEFANTKDAKSSYMRYKIGASYKYGKKAIFEPQIGVEAFQHLRSGRIGSVRYSIGGDFRLTKHNYIEIVYMAETEFNTRVLINIFEVGYTYKF